MVRQITPPRSCIVANFFVSQTGLRVVFVNGGMRDRRFLRLRRVLVQYDSTNTCNPGKRASTENNPGKNPNEELSSKQNMKYEIYYETTPTSSANTTDEGDTLFCEQFNAELRIDAMIAETCTTI